MIASNRLVTHKMVARSILITVLLCGCSYHGQLKQTGFSNNQNIFNKSSTKVTLLNQNANIQDIHFTVGSTTYDYDIKESYINEVSDLLRSVYNQVEISSDVSAKSPLIAIPKFI